MKKTRTPTETRNPTPTPIETESTVIPEPIQLEPITEPEPIETEPAPSSDEEEEEDEMPDNTPRMRAPVDFEGDRNKTTQFIQEVEIHHLLRADIYKTDNSKIGFTLSYMTEGIAAA